MLFFLFFKAMQQAALDPEFWLGYAPGNKQSNKEL